MTYAIIIPARMASTRLPGKPLVNIAGKSMISRTFEQCAKAVDPSLIYVATDSEEIGSHCREQDIRVIMTSSSCLTGTDRVAECTASVDCDLYINVQGDEPLVNPEDIKKVIQCAAGHPGEVINGYTAIDEEEMWRSLSTPKVVVREDERLLYMSRTPIPGNKKDEFVKGWRQVCIYAFPKSSLLEFTNRGKKSELEEIEDLEILRFLEMGYDVRMVELSSQSIAVDNPEDVTKVEQALKRNYE